MALVLLDSLMDLLTRLLEYWTKGPWPGKGKPIAEYKMKSYVRRMMTMRETLDQLHDRLDEIGPQLVDLSKTRMDTVLQVAQSKKESGKPVLDRSRERQVLARVAEQVGEPYEPYSTVLWNVLFDLSRSYQNQMLSQGSPLAQAIESACQNTPPLFPKKATVAVPGRGGRLFPAGLRQAVLRCPPCCTSDQFEGRVPGGGAGPVPVRHPAHRKQHRTAR